MYGSNRVWTLQFHMQNGGMRESRAVGHRRDGTTEGVAMALGKGRRNGCRVPRKTHQSLKRLAPQSDREQQVRAAGGGWGAESIQG